MAENKHTAGPWKIDFSHPRGLPGGISARDGGRPVTRFNAFARPSTPEALANARLIAAAPDLLEACRDAAGTFRRYEALHADKGTVDGAQKAAANASFAKSLEAVIARATQPCEV